MNHRASTRFVVFAALVSAPLASAQFYGDPPDEHHPWAVHDMNRPQPPRVEPGAKPGAPPSDAVVLQTDGAPPTAPAAPTVCSVGMRHVVVSWTPPESCHGSAVSEYKLEMDGGGLGGPTAVFSGPDLTAQVKQHRGNILVFVPALSIYFTSFPRGKD